MNDVDLKLSYVPVVTLEMSLDYVLHVSPKNAKKEKEDWLLWKNVIIVIRSVKKTMSWNFWEIIEPTEDLHWIIVKEGVRELWHHVLFLTLHQIFHLDFNQFIIHVVVFSAIVMKHVSTSICCIQGGGWCWPFSVQKNNKKTK